MAPEDEKVEKLVDDYLERRVDRRGFLKRAGALGHLAERRGRAARGLRRRGGGGGPAARRACTRGDRSRPRPSRPRPSRLRPSRQRPGRPRQAGRSGSASQRHHQPRPAFYPAGIRRDRRLRHLRGARHVQARHVGGREPARGDVRALGRRPPVRLQAQGGDPVPRRLRRAHRGGRQVLLRAHRRPDEAGARVALQGRLVAAPARRCRVDDTYSGTIILKEPFAPIMATTLPVFSGWIVSKKAVEERGEDFATSPIGTGPYEFVEWKPKQQVTPQALRGLRRRVDRLPRHALGRDRSSSRSTRTRRPASRSRPARSTSASSAQRGRPLRGERRLHGRDAHDARLQLDRHEHPEPEAGGHQRAPGDPLRDRRPVHPRGRLRGPVRAGDRDPAAGHADRLLGRRAGVRAGRRQARKVLSAGEHPAPELEFRFTEETGREGDRRDRAGEPRRHRHQRHAQEARQLRLLRAREGGAAEPRALLRRLHHEPGSLLVDGVVRVRPDRRLELDVLVRRGVRPAALRGDQGARPGRSATTCTSRCRSSGTRRRTRSGSRWPTRVVRGRQGIEPALRPDGRFFPRVPAV